MTRLIALYGLVLVFANVLVAQLGLPIPAAPLLIAVGALAADGKFSATASLAVAVIATVTADSMLYVAGRIYGLRLLKLLSRVSPSLIGCGQRTDSRSYRMEVLKLLLAKFIPGISIITPALAGCRGLSYLRFLLIDAVGAALWAGAALTIGMLFRAEINDLIGSPAILRAIAFCLLPILLVGYLAYKWRQRHRLDKILRGARITVEELQR
jgi:membrane protein DedA with SNARE-associated domain